MKNKILKTFFDRDTGYTYVRVQNKYGIFHGHSLCSEEDLPNFSEFAGERYALLRAEKEFAKLRLKQEKIKLQTIKNLIKDISNSVDFIREDDPVMRKINLKLRDYSQSVSDWENLYNHYEPEIKHQDALRQDVLSRSKRNKLSK